jgi:hypothetical protein
VPRARRPTGHRSSESFLSSRAWAHSSSFSTLARTLTSSRWVPVDSPSASPGQVDAGHIPVPFKKNDEQFPRVGQFLVPSGRQRHDGQPMKDDDKVRLRPVEERDLEALGRIDTDPAVSEPFEWRGFRDPKARRRRWEADGYLSSDGSLLVIATSDGSFAGFVSWTPILTSGPRDGCFRIGILLFPEYREKRLGPLPSDCWPTTFSRPRWPTAWRRPPRLTTSPSSGLWSTRGSSARASCGAGDSSVGNGEMESCTPGSVMIQRLTLVQSEHPGS